MLGRAFASALASAGRAGVENLLGLIEKEFRVAMALAGATRISDLNADLLANVYGEADSARELAKPSFERLERN